MSCQSELRLISGVRRGFCWQPYITKHLAHWRIGKVSRMMTSYHNRRNIHLPQPMPAHITPHPPHPPPTLANANPRRNNHLPSDQSNPVSKVIPGLSHHDHQILPNFESSLQGFSDQSADLYRHYNSSNPRISAPPQVLPPSHPSQFVLANGEHSMLGAGDRSSGELSKGDSTRGNTPPNDPYAAHLMDVIRKLETRNDAQHNDLFSYLTAFYFFEKTAADQLHSDPNKYNTHYRGLMTKLADLMADLYPSSFFKTKYSFLLNN